MEQQRETTEGTEPRRASNDAAPVRARPTWLVWGAVGLLVVAVAVASYLWVEQRRADDTLSGVQRSALAKWERAVRRDPENTRARLALAYAYRQAGRHDECISQCREVLDVEPNNVTALYNRGMSLLALDRPDAAESDLWRVLELEPDHVQASVALGHFYADRKQYRSLLVAVRPVVGEHPEVATLQFLTGLGYEHTGHPDWAIARYRMALKRNPDLAEALDGLERLDAEP